MAASLVAVGCIGTMAQTSSVEVQSGSSLGPPVHGKPRPRPLQIVSTRSAPVTGPVLGYAWFPRRSEVKAILGVPGAAYVGAVVEMGGPFRTVAVSSAHRYALAVTQETGQAVVAQLSVPGDPPVSVDIPQVRENADWVVLSPSGMTAGLYHRRSRALEIVKSLPHNPQPAGDVMLTGLPSLITAVAVSDNATGILVAVSAGSRGEIYSVQPGSPPRFLTAVKRATSLSFAPRASDALIVDYEDNSIFLVEDVFGRADIRPVAGPHHGVSQPSAAEFLHDGIRFLVANSGNNRILVFDRFGEVLDVLRPRRAPVMLQRLDDEGTFQFSAPEQGAVGLLRTAQAGNEIFFAAASGDSPVTSSSQGPLPPRSRSSSNARGR